MMPKQYLFILILLVLVKETTAQSWQWARRGGAGGSSGTNYDGVYDMVVDKNGNTYSLITFDGDYPRTIATSNDIPTDDSDLAIIGVQDVGIVSYNKCGKLRWSKIIGTLSQDYAVNIGLDTVGGVYASFFSNYFNLKIGSDTLIPNNKRKSINLLKLDTSGHYKWVKQANPDTTSINKNITQYGTFASYTTHNGDTYMFCLMGTGLISGSTNLVATTPGWYMLKYNSVGIPKELTKMEISFNDNLSFSASNFKLQCSSSGKFFLSARLDFYGTTGPSYFGNQKVNTSSEIGCFNSNGQLLWKLSTNDSTKYAGGKAYWDEDKKLLFIGGYIQNGSTYLGVTAPTVAFSNSSLSMVACVDTFGNKVWLNHSLVPPIVVNGTSSGLSVGAITANGKFICGGSTTGQVYWGSSNLYDSKGITQGYIAAFDATTGNIVNFDSVRDNGGRSSIIVYAADNANNVYASVDFSNNLTIGSQSFGLIGGSKDFSIVKYGFNDCTILPLKFTNYTLRQAQGDKIENKWVTANEVNVSHFNVQLSINGKDFITIGKVNASCCSYEFIDDIRNLELGIRNLFYRLEMVDKDGSKTYSEIRNVELGIRNGAISVYPNPAKDIVNIECLGAKELLIIDNLGRTIYRSTVNSQPLTVNTKQFAKGIFIVKATINNGDIKTEKLVVE